MQPRPGHNLMGSHMQPRTGYNLMGPHMQPRPGHNVLGSYKSTHNTRSGSPTSPSTTSLCPCLCRQLARPFGWLAVGRLNWWLSASSLSHYCHPASLQSWLSSLPSCHHRHLIITVILQIMAVIAAILGSQSSFDHCQYVTTVTLDHCHPLIMAVIAVIL
eukprot:1158454-Pelagomonas_calceolata.AAC.13